MRKMIIVVLMVAAAALGVVMAQNTVQLSIQTVGNMPSHCVQAMQPGDTFTEGWVLASSPTFTNRVFTVPSGFVGDVCVSYIVGAE